MNSSLVSPFAAFTETYINERCGEVNLEVERHADRYPVYAEYCAAYLKCREHLTHEHPDIRMELDELVSQLHLAHAVVSREIYKQSLRDCSALFRFLFAVPNIEEENA